MSTRAMVNGVRGFTLVEIMAATTVLSAVLLLMVGMQDQMSKAWANANRRTETGREARAALRMITTDIASMKLRAATNVSGRSAMAGMVANRPVPMVFYNGSGSAPLTIAQRQGSSAYLFMVLPATLSSSGDLNLVGYYVASRVLTNLNGLVSSNYHLMRYRRDGATAVSSLASWFADPTQASLSLLFAGINPATDEILAYNVANFSVQLMGYGVNLGGTASSNSLASGTYVAFKDMDEYGARAQVSLTLLPEVSAQKLPPSQWSNSTSLSRDGRSYEARVRRMAREEEAKVP